MPALGEEFRSAREARGLSLSDVAERLHIRGVYLAAIEDEDWKAIGAPVYVRGFMRTYARFLGLDAEAAVSRFTQAAGAPAPSTTPRLIEERPREPDPSGSSGRPSVVAMLAVLLAVAVVAYVGYSYAQYRAGTPVTASATAAASPGVVVPVVDPANDGLTPRAAGTAPSRAAAKPTPPAAHGLHVAVTQTSWVLVKVDGTVVAEGTFPPGTAKSFAGHVADVRVGNAGGVDIAVNGRPIGKLGNDGDVVERHFVLSGE
jgi:cytoskeletal protein RodZ